MVSLALSPVDRIARSSEPVELQVREIEVPSHKGSGRLLAFWTECRSLPNGLVVGRDLPSAPLAKILSCLYLLEPVDKELTDFRFRLAPTGLLRRFGVDVSGRLVSEFYRGGALDEYIRALQRAIQYERPTLWDVHARWSASDALHFERLVVPVRSRDLTQIWVLGGIFIF